MLSHIQSSIVKASGYLAQVQGLPPLPQELMTILKIPSIAQLIKPKEPDADGLQHNLAAGEWSKVSAQLAAFANALVPDFINDAAEGELGPQLQLRALQIRLLQEISIAFGKLGSEAR